MPPVSPQSRRVAVILWISYIVFIAYVTTLPFNFVPSMDLALDKLERVPRHVFQSQSGGRPSISDMAQNIMLFVPFGALTMMVFGHRARMASSVALCAVMGVAVSAAVETMQLFTADRISSLNDLATNAMGAFAGSIGAVVTIRLGRDLQRRVHPDTLVHLYPVLVWGIALAIAAWHPFDASLSVSQTASKVRDLLADPWQQRTLLADGGADALRAALVTVAAVRLFQHLNVNRPVIVGALVAFAAASSLELSQVVFRSRTPGGADVVVASVGIIIGMIVPAFPAARRPPVAAALVIVAAGLGTALMILSPLAIATERRPFELIPFLSYYAARPQNIVSHAVELGLAFFPIGFAIAAAAGRQRAWGLVIMIATSLGVLLEYLQSWIVGRYPDVTDICVLVLGACLGTWVATRTVQDVHA